MYTNKIKSFVSIWKQTLPGKERNLKNFPGLAPKIPTMKLNYTPNSSLSFQGLQFTTSY
jgi:hypothetical protein